MVTSVNQCTPVSVCCTPLTSAFAMTRLAVFFIGFIELVTVTLTTYVAQWWLWFRASFSHHTEIGKTYWSSTYSSSAYQGTSHGSCTYPHSDSFSGCNLRRSDRPLPRPKIQYEIDQIYTPPQIFAEVAELTGAHPRCPFGPLRQPSQW